jgi:hypothetical protein
MIPEVPTAPTAPQGLAALRTEVDKLEVVRLGAERTRQNLINANLRLRGFKTVAEHVSSQPLCPTHQSTPKINPQTDLMLQTTQRVARPSAEATGLAKPRHLEFDNEIAGPSGIVPKKRKFRVYDSDDSDIDVLEPLEPEKEKENPANVSIYERDCIKAYTTVKGQNADINNNLMPY